MATVLLVIGLPGSGKTHYVMDVAGSTGARDFDDFKANAFHDSPEFRFARRFGELVSELWRGRDCTISDIDFCRPESLCEAEEWIRKAAPAATAIVRRYFAPDRNQCIANVTARAQRENRDLPREITNIDKYVARSHPDTTRYPSGGITTNEPTAQTRGDR